MIDNLTVSLVITTYNWPEALNLILFSVLRQTVLPHEILIADDGSGQQTKLLIDSFREKSPIPVRHFWHEDNGFQKTIILNRAIAHAKGNYIVQIDGDIVLQKNFIRDHIQAAEVGYYIRGGRVLLGERRSQKLLAKNQFKRPFWFSNDVRNRLNMLRSPLLSPIFSKRNKRSDNFIGCNCAFWMEDFIKINGYNDAFVGWGHEDIELAARFVNAGLKQKKLKMLAICFHLYHPFNDRNQEKINFRIYEQVIKSGTVYCENGLDKYLSPVVAAAHNR